MITAKEKMLELLQQQPLARERKNKNRAIAYMLCRRYHITGELSPAKLEEIIVEAATLDRAWRQILQQDEYKHLRGKDYGDKEMLEQEKQIELGYEPGGQAKLPKHITG